jgi:ribonuclease BN (tRNA processing enzyme)
LTVLGNAERYLAPASRGSGYLLEAGEARLLLDCGGGIADAPGLHPERLDAVVVSHFHHDHVLDLMRLRDAFPKGMPLVVPPGERARLDDLARAFAFRGSFDTPARVVEASTPLRVGDVELRFARAQHSAPAIATRIGHFVYAGDAAPSAELADLARDCDALLMHALLPTVDPTSAHAHRHATAESAARLAIDAGARRLLLSHRHHTTRDEDVRRAAAAHPRVELLASGGAYDI